MERGHKTPQGTLHRTGPQTPHRTAPHLGHFLNKISYGPIEVRTTPDEGDGRDVEMMRLREADAVGVYPTLSEFPSAYSFASPKAVSNADKNEPQSVTNFPSAEPARVPSLSVWVTLRGHRRERVCLPPAVRAVERSNNWRQF